MTTAEAPHDGPARSENQVPVVLANRDVPLYSQERDSQTEDVPLYSSSPEPENISDLWKKVQAGELAPDTLVDKLIQLGSLTSEQGQEILDIAATMHKGENSVLSPVADGEEELEIVRIETYDSGAPDQAYSQDATPEPDSTSKAPLRLERIFNRTQKAPSRRIARDGRRHSTGFRRLGESVLLIGAGLGFFILTGVGIKEVVIPTYRNLSQSRAARKDAPKILADVDVEVKGVARVNQTFEWDNYSAFLVKKDDNGNLVAANDLTPDNLGLWIQNIRTKKKNDAFALTQIENLLAIADISEEGREAYLEYVYKTMPDQLDPALKELINFADTWSDRVTIVSSGGENIVRVKDKSQQEDYDTAYKFVQGILKVTLTNYFNGIPVPTPTPIAYGREPIHKLYDQKGRLTNIALASPTNNPNGLRQRNLLKSQELKRNQDNQIGRGKV